MEVSQAHRQIPVTEASQPSAARFAAHAAAGDAGFREEASYRAGLVATELATNLVKHASGGEVLVRCSERAGQGEVEIISIDRGPGIADVSRAMEDGRSTAGSAGTGLGAVRRLSDEFDVFSQPGRGTVILARLRGNRDARPASRPLLFGGVSVPRRGETACGDAWQVDHRDDGTLAVVVDGLGHGLLAAEASRAAVSSVPPGANTGVTAILERMHGAIRHTRGVAAAVAEIRRNPRLMKFAGVGNVSMSVCRETAVRHAVSVNGILGHGARSLREYAYPWDPQSLFVMHSDGLGSRWSFDEYRGLRQRHPALVAAVLYRDFARERDDVTVVVGREAA